MKSAEKNSSWSTATGVIIAWQNYWFSPGDARTVVILRYSLCLFAFLWFTSGFLGASQWLGASGLVDSRLGGQLIEFEETARWQHWSPLWWTDNSLLHQVWAGIGMGLALAAAFGLGGRWVLALLLFFAIAWAHRLTWLVGLATPALLSLLGYLLIAEPRGDGHWRNNLSLRLVQTHWWLLVAFGLLTQLASLAWWQGEAVWWLASAGRSNLLDTESLRGHPMWINFLTHGFLFTQALALWLTAVRPARGLGILAGLLVAMGYALLGDQLLYGLLIACCLPAFLASKQPS